MSDDFIYSFLKQNLQKDLINNLTEEFKNENIEDLDEFIKNKVYEITNDNLDFTMGKEKKITDKKNLNAEEKVKHDKKEMLKQYRIDNKSITLDQNNPKAKDSQIWDNYEKYKSARTIEEMFKLGGDTVNFRNDIWLNYKRGFLTLDE